MIFLCLLFPEIPCDENVFADALYENIPQAEGLFKSPEGLPTYGWEGTFTAYDLRSDEEHDLVDDAAFETVRV